MAANQRSNIVVLLADDLGYGDIGYFNEGRTDTPAIDELIVGGVSLRHHYSASPVCSPARASLLTGRYPQRTGATDTLETRGLDRIATEETTVADYLRSVGYKTGLIGKWHNGAIDRRYHPRSRGFDEFFGFLGGWQDYYQWLLDDNGTRRRSDGRYLTDVLATEAVEFVRRHRHESFFMLVAFNAPHTPLQAPPEVMAGYAAASELTPAVKTLYGMVTRLDHAIGMIVSELEALGLTNNTLILFTSDNGPQFSGDGGRSTVRFNCNFSGHKTLVLEGGIRLPTVLSWPGHLRGGESCDTVVHMTDWLPTLCKIAGYTSPWSRALDGVDVSAVLEGEPANVPSTRFWQWNRYEPIPYCNAAMRQGNWKLLYPAINSAMVVADDDKRDDERFKSHPQEYRDIVRRPPKWRQEAGTSELAVAGPQLYNLEKDPEESHDVAGSNPSLVSRMVAQLETWFEEMEADRRVAQAETLGADR